MQVINIASICDAIILNDVLHKRKVFLDAFAEGLEVFSIKRGISAFPEIFRALFVASDMCCPEDILSILHFDELDDNSRRVAEYLKSVIQKLGESGKS